MKRIAPHLRWLGSAFSNIWLLENPGDRKRILVDTGHAIDRLPLLGSLWQASVRLPGDLAGVLLTHRHADHAGNAAWLRKHFGVPVFCHEDDAVILRGDKIPAAPNRESTPFYKEWISRIGEKRPAFCDIDETYAEGAWKWGFRVTSVPGHTEGSVMLYHEPTATLFSGDSIVSGGYFPGRSRKLRIADPDFCVEPESAKRSIRRYLDHLPPVEILCPGHGPVIDEAAFNKLKKLIQES